MTRTLAEQALAAHTAGDTALLERTLDHAFSVEATLPEEEPGAVELRHHFPDRSTFRYRTEYGAGEGIRGAGTDDELFRVPVICSRRCCNPIRRLADPEAPAPTYDGSHEPRRGGPTDRSVRTG